MTLSITVEKCLPFVNSWGPVAFPFFCNSPANDVLMILTFFYLLGGKYAGYRSNEGIPSFVQITLPKEIALRQVMILPRTETRGNKFVQPMIYVSSSPQGNAR